MRRERVQRWIVGSIAIIVSAVVFLVPFVFIILQAAKDPAEASALAFTLPKEWRTLGQPRRRLPDQRQSDHHGVRQQRRPDRLQRHRHGGARRDGRLRAAAQGVEAEPGGQLPRAGRTHRAAGGRSDDLGAAGSRAVQDAARPRSSSRSTFGLSFSILLFRAFVATIPRELDEAAVLDGTGPIRLFFQVILPLLRPVIVTVIVVQAVAVFNDFTNPLYFLPGSENATVQLTLYNFQSQTLSQYNLLFMDILLITIPPLVMYIFFNRQIVAGLTSGAVKG